MSRVVDEIKEESPAQGDSVGQDLDVIEKKSEGIAGIMADMRKSIDRHGADIKDIQKKNKAILEYQDSAEFKTQVDQFLTDIKAEQEKSTKELMGQVEMAKQSAEEIKQLFINQHRAATGAGNTPESDTKDMIETMYKSLEYGAMQKNGAGYGNEEQRKSLEFSEREIKSWGDATGTIEQKTVDTLNHHNMGVLMLPPTVFMEIIEKKLLYYSDLIKYIDLRRIRGYQAKHITQLQHGIAQWGDESVPIVESQIPAYGEDSIDVWRLQYRYGLNYESILNQRMNLRQMIETDMMEAIAFKKDEALVKGSGIKKPRGFLNDIGGDGIQIVKTGTVDTITDADFIMRVIQDFDPKYRRDRTNFRFIMNSLTSYYLQVLKDNNGLYLLRSLSDQSEFKLFGKPIIENEHMDDIGANTIPIVVADWKKMIRGIMPTVAGIQITDQYTQAEQGKIMYQNVLYFGAKVIDFLAGRAIKVAV